MAFPSIASPGSGNSGANTTSWSFSFGFTATAGRLLILIAAADGNPTIGASGFTEIFQTPDGTVCKLSAWKKIAEGGETSQTITASAGEAIAATIYEITGSNGLTNIEIGTASTGSTANPNPPQLALNGWGTEDNLWIACCGWDQNKTLSTYPTNYSLGQLNSVYNQSTNGVGVASAARQNAVATEDPGTFTISTADNSVAQTIGIRPLQAINIGNHFNYGGPIFSRIVR